MNTVQGLKAKKKEILEQINALGEMRKGSIVQQYVEAKKQDGTIVQRGPYLLYSYKEKGKTVSRRIPDSTTADFYRDQIRVFRKFEDLCEELTRISQQICDLLEPDDINATISGKKNGGCYQRRGCAGNRGIDRPYFQHSQERWAF